MMFNIAETLLLVPTDLEHQRLAGFADWPAFEKHVHLCGFGPIAAAARAATLVERMRPRQVMLFGIAGTYDPQRLPVGEAMVFERVSIDGVGAGVADGFISAADLGFPQSGMGGEESIAEHDDLCLAVPEGEPAAGRLLTVCAASAGLKEVEERRVRFPDALAEEMEAFGVALACRSAQVPLTVVRGVANLAGNRDVAHWHIDAALDSAWRACRRFVT